MGETRLLWLCSLVLNIKLVDMMCNAAVPSADMMPGWFNAYGYAAEIVKPDIFIHLGDYVCFLIRPIKI